MMVALFKPKPSPNNGLILGFLSCFLVLQAVKSKRKMNNNFMIFLKHLNYKIMNIFLLLDKIRKKLYLNKLYKN